MTLRYISITPFLFFIIAGASDNLPYFDIIQLQLIAQKNNAGFCTVELCKGRFKPLYTISKTQIFLDGANANPVGF
jgi:hypothetical protein